MRLKIDCIKVNMLEMSGRRGSLQRFMDVVRKDTQRVAMTEDAGIG